MPNNNSRIISKLNRCRPRKEDETGTFEVVSSIDEILSEIKYVLHSGIPSFDDITGGIPFGRVTEIYGLEGCGKSALVQLLAVQAQRGEIFGRDGTKLENPTVTVLYIDNEQSIDSGARTVIDGTALDIILARCDTVDQLFKMADTTIQEVHEIEKETGVPQFVLIVVDTIAGTSSAAEMSQAWDKEDYPRQSKILSKAFRRMTRKINRCNVAMVCVNQVRDSFKQSYGSYASSEPQDADFSTFGGKALKFYATLRVFMYAINSNYKFSRDSHNSQGILIRFKTSKNRVKKPLRKGAMVLLFEGGLNSKFSILEHLIFTEMAEYQKDGSIQFKLKANSVPTDGFQIEGRKQNPSIKSRIEWPAYYAAHKDAFDLLWKKCVVKAFLDERSEQEHESSVDDDDFIELDENTEDSKED